ncbi:MAG: polymer-forming cytoskeletal protein, partial [Phycisphaerales bacterium]|nr:polymer-forming cytoskeletal protein [Phycisphaerales bacterium]
HDANKNRVTPASATPTTVIGVNARINGDILLDGDASVLGKVEGRLEVGGELHIGSESQVTAQVVCERLNLEGTVRGDVFAAKGLELGASASLIGDISAGCISVPAGATCQGTLSVGPNAAQAAKDGAKNGRTTSTSTPANNGKSMSATAETKPSVAREATTLLESTR